jgi:hypothetical protein
MLKAFLYLLSYVHRLLKLPQGSGECGAGFGFKFPQVLAPFVR